MYEFVIVVIFIVLLPEFAVTVATFAKVNHTLSFNITVFEVLLADKISEWTLNPPEVVNVMELPVNIKVFILVR